MFCRVTCGSIVVVLVLIASSACRARSFVEAMGFEIGGVTGPIQPDEYNEVFDRIGVGDLDQLAGFTVGLMGDLDPNIRVAIRSGYLRGSTGTGQIYIRQIPFPMISTEFKYTAETIPLSVGADFRLVNKATALVASLAGEIHFLSLTETLEPQPLAEFSGSEESSRATLLGFNGAIGVEWQASRVVLIGLRGGYRFAEDAIAYPSDSSFSPSFDISGGYGGMYLIVRPWTRVNRGSG